MDIPVKAKVQCADGLCGRSTYVVINPTVKQVTHLVVKGDRSPHVERLVPVDLVLETSPKLIRLRCTQEKMEELEPFMETDYLQGDLPYLDLEYEAEEYFLFPYVTPAMPIKFPLGHQRIPPDELAVRRGAAVEATDGRVGRVDEFLINPPDGHITHLVLREGHLWGKKDVTIPVSEIARIEASKVFLKLNKERIEALPAIPLKR